MSQDYFVGRAEKTKAELVRVIRDAEEWNRNNPHVAIDPDPGGLLARKIEELDRLLVALAVGDAPIERMPESEGQWLADPSPIESSFTP